MQTHTNRRNISYAPTDTADIYPDTGSSTPAPKPLKQKPNASENNSHAYKHTVQAHRHIPVTLWGHRFNLMDTSINFSLMQHPNKYFKVKSENMFTVHQGTNTPPPLARIVSSLLCWCIGNYGIYYKVTLHTVFVLLILAVISTHSEAEVYPYRYGNDQKIVTIKGLPLDLSRFDTVANGYIPHKGGNDFIIMEQFDKNCGPNSVQMLLYYHRKHRRLKDIWGAADINTVAFGTVPSELRQALNELDVSAHWYSRRTPNDLRRYIDENRPPIMLLRLSNRGYHWVVAVGYDTRWDEFLIADPNGHFKWWTAEQLKANWSLEWLPEFEADEEEWYEFQVDVGLINNIHLNPHTVIVPLEAPSFETSYRDYWSDTQAIEVYGNLEFRGGTREWEEILTFENPFSIVQVSDIELLTSTGTARVDGWERINNNHSIRLWGTIEDGWFLRGRMWVIVRTFYFNDVAAADINTAKAPSALPIETALLPNYPNPFNPETWIPYQLAKPADVSVSIYAADGKLVRHLALGHKQTGIYHNKSRAVYWDGKNTQGEPVASGIYFYTLKADDFRATKKMLIRK